MQFFIKTVVFVCLKWTILFIMRLKKLIMGYSFWWCRIFCLLFLKLFLSDSVDGITCTTQYTGIFKNRFLPEDGYKYAGLIWEYNEERLTTNWSFCSVSSSAHALIIILRVIKHLFSRWKYVSVSVMEVLCEPRSLSVLKLTLPRVIIIIIRRLWYTHYFNSIAHPLYSFLVMVHIRCHVTLLRGHI